MVNYGISKITAGGMEVSVMWSLSMTEYLDTNDPVVVGGQQVCKATYEVLNHHRTELRQFLEDILAKERARNESPSPDPTSNT